MRKYVLPLAALLTLLLVGFWGADLLLDLGAGDDEESIAADLHDPAPEPADETEDDALLAPVFVPPPEPPEAAEAGRAQAAPAAAQDPAATVVAEDEPEDEGDPGVVAWEGEAGRRRPQRTGVGRTSSGPSGIHHEGNLGTSPDDAEAWVPPDVAWFGTPKGWVQGVLRQYGENAPAQIALEAPRHSREMDGYWIERWEVSNERYRRFLEQRHGVRFTTPLGRAETILETTAVLLGPGGLRGRDLERAGFQLYRTNLPTLRAALPGLVVTLQDDSRLVDDVATWEQMKDAELPEKLRLYFYDRAPPRYWPDIGYPAGKEDNPVRDLSGVDAIHFALWAGKHVPSEFEWEYAARGRQGQDYPWGGNPKLFPEVVNGGQPRPEEEEVIWPETVEIRAYPGGASWVDCRNMLGNVAEWTSSFLDPYGLSGGASPSRFVVARGGSARDETPLFVRTAYRGWDQGREEDDGVAPYDPRLWTGVRLARYEEAARSRVPSMHTLVRLGEVIPAGLLVPRVYAGWQGVLEKRILLPRQDPTVRMGAKSFVVQPFRMVLLLQEDGNLRPGVPEDVTTTEALVSLSHVGPVLLGLFQNDLLLLRTYREREEGRPARPTLDSVSTPPGTWVVAFDRGYVALFDPLLHEEYFLTRGPVSSGTVGVIEQRARPGRSILPRAEIHRIASAALKHRIGTPLGNFARPDLLVNLRIITESEREVVERISDWRYGALAE